jgi:hypothetical protein
VAKSSKSAKSDRQKVIDDIRRQQKRSEKRQGTVIVGVCVVIALGIVLIAAWEPMTTSIRKAALTGDTVEEIGASADVCQEVVTEPQAGNQHVEPQQVQYQEAPPATGDHWNEAGVAPAPVSQRFYTASDRPELESLVHNSEHGYNILWYDETVADDDGQMAEIQKIADIMDVNDTNGRNKFKAVPWTSDDATEVAKSLDAAVASAEEAVTAAEKAVKDASSKKDEKAAEQQLESARKELAKAQKSAESGGQFPDDQHIAYTHWTADGQAVHQYCSGVSGEALQEFMFDYPYSDTPEPDAM